MDHLLEKVVVKGDKECASSHSPFIDLSSVGLKKLTTTSWLQDILTKGVSDGDADEDPHILNENEELFENF